MNLLLTKSGSAKWLEKNADYSMYSTFLTASPGSVLFSRSNLLERKDLCFSYLRLGLIRYRRSLRSSHLSSQVLHDSHRVTLEFAMLWMNGDMKERTFHIQTQHKISRSDHGLEHAKILVGGLTLDRCLVEAAEGMDDALLALARRSVKP